MAEVNPVKKRMLFLSPSVASGKERECRVSDFESVSHKAIGQGAFGQVYKVRHIQTGNLYAIKAISKNKILAKGLLQQMRREVRIMYSLDHPNIIKLYNHFEDDKNFYLILELAEGGALFHKLVKLRSFDEATACQYMREVALAVQYLHTREPPIIHRDIKPENIFLDNDGVGKLGDFGWSSTSEEVRSTYCGTLEYLAPEMIDRIGHDIRLDLWNLGILLFELLSGRAPFQSKNQNELFQKIKACKIGFPKNYPLGAKDLTRKLLKPNPNERISIEQMLSHAWMVQHEPLRSTCSLTTMKEILPETPLDQEVQIEFQEHEYKIISNPEQAETQYNQEKTIRAKVKNKILKVKESMMKKKQQISQLEETIRNTQLESHNIQRAIADLRIQALQTDMSSIDFTLEQEREDIQDKILLTQHSIRQHRLETNIKRKERRQLKQSYLNKQLNILGMENSVRGYKNFMRALKWNSTSATLIHIQDLFRILQGLKKNQDFSWAFQCLETMRKEASSRSELYKIVESHKDDIQERNNQIADLRNEYEKLRAVFDLKKTVCTVYTHK